MFLNWPAIGSQPCATPRRLLQEQSLVMDRTPTFSDVAQCYRLFLERDVEDATTAVRQMADVPTLWELINRFASSAEALRRKIHRASGLIGDTYDPSLVRMEVTDAQREELMVRTLERWERCGRGTAYDHFFRDPRLFDDRSDKWNREKRFEIGNEEIERLCVAGKRNGIVFAPNASVLALGCEVGFLAKAAAQRFASFVGIEVGGRAFEQGCAALDEREIPGSQVISLRSFLDSTPAYGGRNCDIFYSTMVLQHAPPPVGLMLLHMCLGRIKPGGYAYFQVPSHIYDYRYDSGDYLRALSEPGRSDESGEIHALPQIYVLQLLARHGLVPIEILPEQRLGPMGLSFTFFARKQG